MYRFIHSGSCAPCALHPGLLATFLRQLPGLVALFFLASALVAQAATDYRVEPATVAMGEPVTLTLTSKPGVLDKLDLSPIAKDFEINGRNQGSDGKEESLVLTLYPLRTGRFVLPNLGLRGRPPTLTVNEQSENVPRVRFYSETSPQPYHTRQFVRLTIEACDDGSLMWQRPQLPTREGLFLRALNEEQIDVERDGERCTAHRWHWALQPTVAGTTSLPLPMLEANKFGQRLRFPPPEIKLDALPIPGWLPSDASIGKPDVSVMPMPEAWPVDRPMALRMEIGGGYSAEALSNLLRVQLANQPQFGRYDPVVEESGHDNGVPRHTIVLYPVFSETGNFKLPELVFPWYEPESGKLQQLKVPASNMRIINPAMQRLMTWLTWLGAALAFASVAYLMWRQLGWRLRRHRALARLKHVSSIDDLSRELRSFDLRAAKAPAATLGEWQQRMNREASVQGLEELRRSIEAGCYGNSKTELNSLIEQARSCLSNANPKP